MRGSDEHCRSLFDYVDLEARIRSDHPLRTIREIVNGALKDLSEHSRPFMPILAGHRLHRRSCFGRCCCRRFTAFAPNAN